MVFYSNAVHIGQKGIKADLGSLRIYQVHQIIRFLSLYIKTFWYLQQL